MKPSYPEENKSNSTFKLCIDDESYILYDPNIKKYIYFYKAPPIKNLVISDGGAKGVVIPGILQAFEEFKDSQSGLSFRDQLECIAGSSVGALTGLFIATGVSSEMLIKITGNTNFENLLGEGSFNKKASELLLFIKKTIKESITTNLLQHFNAIELKDIDLSDKPELKSIINELEKSSIDEMHITFEMLFTLHQLNPHVFKKLIVTATQINPTQTWYFNDENTPLLDIALACRASASLPFILEPVKIEKKYLGKRAINPIEEFIDGGYLDNIPVKAVHDKQGLTRLNQGVNEQNLQTLALIFDDTNSHDQSVFLDERTKGGATYSPTMKDIIIRDMSLKIIMATTEKNTEAKRLGLEKIRTHYTQRHIALPITLKSTDFNEAMQNASRYMELGKKVAKSYLDIHEDAGLYISEEEYDSLLKCLPIEKTQKLQQDQVDRFLQAIKYFNSKELKPTDSQEKLFFNDTHQQILSIFKLIIRPRKILPSIKKIGGKGVFMRFLSMI